MPAQPLPSASGFPTARATTALREQLTADIPCQLMGVHDGLSSRIAVEEGFRALWASGLCISTALGVRDSDEASWDALLDVVATIVRAAPSVPVLVDGDTGHGNFNTARLFSSRAERIGAAGVCFEDKTFPKMNSFFGDEHLLAPIGEVCGKLKACKDTQNDPDFVLVARTEALIAESGLEEALTRACAYADSGADALFVHSRRSTDDQIREFTRSWDFRIPVIIAPTTYHSTPLSDFTEMGIGGVIWANQPIRAAFSAMRNLCHNVKAAQGVSGVEPNIASLKEIFALLSYEELEQDERYYSALTPDRTVLG